MAKRDWCPCDRCGRKAIFDPSHYLRNLMTECRAAEIAVLCADCAKGHMLMVAPKPSAQPDAERGK